MLCYERLGRSSTNELVNVVSEEDIKLAYIDRIRRTLAADPVKCKQPLSSSMARCSGLAEPSERVVGKLLCAITYTPGFLAIPVRYISRNTGPEPPSHAATVMLPAVASLA